MENKYTAINGTDYMYYIDDNGNHILVKREMRQKMNRKTRRYEGEPVEFLDTVGYYTSLSNMICAVVKDMAKHKQQSNEFKNVVEHIAFIQKQYDKIIEMCREV